MSDWRRHRLRNRMAVYVYNSSGGKVTAEVHDDHLDAMRYTLVPMTRRRRLVGWLRNKWCGVVLWLARRWRT